ncbi:hypothetical protein GO003_010000 [Methylicorpusculum oleiharenae]|uniref:hypothetical protein n=1 Tax=Methylicorpusculum oleiharenae TaxID=1338687 RepID=UPI001358FC6B|nr:hypothetical protein [Methylicorpusculum oleiharenae]MCD2450724.1 hypothetical protein [Methylicorpusculum oleiharenae]
MTIEGNAMEIQPIIPAYPVIRPARVEKDEERNKKNPPHSQNPDNEEDSSGDNEPLQHIDEVV